MEDPNLETKRVSSQESEELNAIETENAVAQHEEVQGLIIALTKTTDRTEILESLSRLEKEAVLHDSHIFAISLLNGNGLPKGRDKDDLFNAFIANKKIFKAFERSTLEIPSLWLQIIAKHPNTAAKKIALKKLIEKNVLDTDSLKLFLIESHDQFSEVSNKAGEMDSEQGESASIEQLEKFIAFLSKWPKDTLDKAGSFAEEIIEIARLEFINRQSVNLRKTCDNFFESFPNETLSQLQEMDIAVPLGSTLKFIPGGFRERFVLQLSDQLNPQLESPELYQKIRFNHIATCIANDPDTWDRALKSKPLRKQIENIVQNETSEKKLNPKILATLIANGQTLLDLTDTEKLGLGMRKLREKFPHIKSLGNLLSEKQLANIKDLYERAKKENDDLKLIQVELENSVKESEANRQLILQQTQSEIDHLKSQVKDQDEKLKLYKSQFVDEQSEVRKASTAELEQQWIDGAKAAISILNAIDRYPKLGDEESSLRDFYQQVAATENIIVVAPIGEIVQFDEKYYDYIGDCAEGSIPINVKVHESAYVTKIFGSERLLARGKVLDG